MPESVLNMRRLPARLTLEQAGELLGFLPHEMSIIISTRASLLKPLGNAAPNAHKYFCTTEILALTNDKSWLNSATKIVSAHWRERNEVNRLNGRAT